MKKYLILLILLASAWGQQFPGAIVEYDDLLVRSPAQGILSQAITSSQTTLTLRAAGIFQSGMSMTIGTEEIYCTTLTGRVFSVCTRGFAGTTPAVHVGGAPISGSLVQRNFARELIAVETALGVNLGNVEGGGGGDGCTPGSGTAGQILVRAADGDCTAATPSISGSTITGNLTGDVAGNADTATALASNPTDCTSNQFATAIAASGNLTCAQPVFSDLSGAATDAQVPDTITASNYLPLAGGTLTGPLLGTRITSTLTTVSFSATPTFNASLGNSFLLTLTGNVTSSTLSNPATGQIITLRLCQDGSGAHTFVPPTNVLGMGTINATASACSNQTFIYDGSNAQAIGVMLSDGPPALILPGSTSGSVTIQAEAAAAGTVNLADNSTTVIADAGTANNFLTAISSAGAISKARPACATLSDSAASCATDATNASNINSGTLNDGRLPGTMDSKTFTTYLIAPQGTGPTVDAAGKIAVDTTSDQFKLYGSAARVIPTLQYMSFVIPAPATTDDINLMKAPYGMAIVGIDAIVQGTTSATGQIQECASDGTSCADLDSDIVADADGAADDGSLTDSTIASGAWLRWKTTSVSGTPTSLAVTVRYWVIGD